MNHIFRVVFNHVCQTYQAVAEIAKGQSKSETTKSASSSSICKKSSSTLKSALRPLSALIALVPLAVHATPTGGHISAGDASISQHGKITNIQQNSQRAAINWQSFGIKADETVNFKQPNAQAVILNRVIGNEKSVIDGAMNANGKVFISNPNGMIIGKNAQINVGALLATTAKIKDQDFMNGFFKFDQATGDITHLGDIKVPTDGVVALIAPIVANKGNITAPQGKVLLASAEQFSITLPDNGQFAYTLDRGTLQGLVDNGGAILADGGHVILTAKGTDAVKKSLIKHTGKIEANTVQNKNGVIELLGDLDNTRLEASGSLKAEAEQGDGGFIETSAAELGINDLQVSTQSKYGKTGTWLIDPKDFTVAPSGGDMTGKKVEESLQSNNVVLKSRDGAKEGKGDVIINDEISWDKNTLTLNAENDIHINKTLNGTGTAKLALEYGQGTANGKYKAIVDGKETELDNDYYLDKNTPLKDRTVKVNLPEGKNFSTKKGSNGEVHEFDVIHKMPEIVKNANGNWESQFTERNIALGKDMDVGYTKDYAGFAGWQLAKDNIDDWGRVAGLGHTVSNLSLHSKKNRQATGLFQKNNNDKGDIKDIGVHNAQVRSEGQDSGTGGLVGYGNGSQISNSYATGSVSSSGYNAHTGGLVGYEGVSQISNSYATGSVSSSGDNAYTGGLVGAGSESQISNSYATGSVSSSGDNVYTGGLVGAGSGFQIPNSYASNPHLSATGKESWIGGLVGGELNYSGVNYKNSFFNQEKHPNLPAIGQIVGDNSKITNVTGKTDSELKDRTTFKGWDFDNVWYMNDGEMPKLRAFATNNQPTPTQPVNPTTTAPAQPTQPSNPVVPNTPTVPTNPTQPANPTTTTPTQPTQPSNPAVPNTPTVPTNPTQPVNPTTTAPTQPTQPNNPVVPITPTVSTNPTQPVNPTTTAPAQPTQPSNPVVPTTPTAPVQPEQDNSIETAKPKFPNWKDFPCKLPKDCIDKGLNKIGEGWNNLKEEHNRKIQALVAEDNREELFYYTNPKINKDDFENYLDEMRRASQNPEYIVDEYLADFPQDLKVSQYNDLTVYEYLSNIIQYQNLVNLQKKYNDELINFADGYIIGTQRDSMVMAHTDKMLEFQDKANHLPKRGFWQELAYRTDIGKHLKDSFYMFQDVADFAVNAGKLTISLAAYKLNVAYEELESVKNTFTGTIKILDNGAKVIGIKNDILDVYSEIKSATEGNALKSDEILAKLSSIASASLELVGDDNALGKAADVQKLIDNADKLKKAIILTNNIPDNLLPNNIKQEIVANLTNQMHLSMFDATMGLSEVIEKIPGINKGNFLGIVQNGAKSLGSIAKAVKNSDDRIAADSYNNTLQKVEHANENYQAAIHYRANAIETMIK